MKIRDGVELKKMGEHFMLRQIGVNGEKKVLCALNETGAFLWNELVAGSDEEKLVSRLKEEYEAGPEDDAAIREDVTDFVLELQKLELLDDCEQ